MEDQFSRLYAGPLSASAHRILAALRAEYADRLDRSHTYLQRRPVNLHQAESTWSQIQSSPSRSWPKPYSSYTGTQEQEESDRPTFLASATGRESSPTHATPLPTWMESAEREPVLPFFTQRRESPIQAEFSLCLDSPQNKHSFHFQSQPGKHSSVQSPQKEPQFPLPSPQRGSPFSYNCDPLKEPPLTPPSMGTGLLGYPRTVSAPRGAVRRLRMPLLESHTDMTASQFQMQLENGSDQARQVTIPSSHTSLENQRRLPRSMQCTRSNINQTVPYKHQMQPESHCEENRQQAEPKPNPNFRLESHQLNPDIGHTESDIGQAGSDNLQTKPHIQTQASSEVHGNVRLDFTDLQKGAEDKDNPSASSPVISVPPIPGVRSRQRGWCMSVKPSREVPESGEQAENIRSPADPAKKGELGHLLLPAHRSPVTTAEIESLDFDRQSAGPIREENSQTGMVLGQSSDRGVAREDDVLLPTGDARGRGEPVAGFDLGAPSEEHLIQVHASMDDAHRGSEDMSATLTLDGASHLLDTRPETELTIDVQPPGAPPGTDSVESLLVLEKTCQPAINLSSADTFLHDNQHERKADDRRDHREQRISGERKDENGAFEKIVWFDRETCMTEPNHLMAPSHTAAPVAEECQPDTKRQKISLTEGDEEMDVGESPVIVVDPCGSEEPGHQRRLGASSKALPFRAPPAVQRNPLHQSQSNSQVLAQSSKISCGSKRHLLTPTVKGVLESPRMASSPFPTCSAPPTPVVDKVTPSSAPPQEPSLTSRRRPMRWEPPRSSQGEPTTQPTATPQFCARPQASKLAPAHPKTTKPTPQARPKTPCPHLSSPLPQRPTQRGMRQQSPTPDGCPVAATADPSGHSRRKRPCNTTQEPPISHQPAPRATNQKETEAGPERPQTGLIGGAREEAGTVTPVPQAATKSKPSLALTSDPRVCEVGRLSAREREDLLEEARMARALVLTLVLQDGSTQLDTEQKNSPCVCGILILVKRVLDLSRPQPTEEEKLLFLRLEQRPVWVKQHPNQNHEQFTRELLLLVLSGQRQVVCYKAKDLLRIILQHYTHTFNWKQLGVCEVQDPQIAAWLLDPGDSAACFQELLNKHCRPNAYCPTHNFTLPQAPQKVTQLISGLNHLYKLMVELRSKLQTKGLWQLYSQMETRMIPVLAAMEGHRIHVDRDALKKTSEMLGSKLKQLEQEAHQAAGQQFLVSSNNQLRLVLFEKLRLHERCENKKLPKTLLKQQQSTSEAVLLQLQDLHPLPKIILEYRQVHKLKSAFVDGILSCMNKTFISSTWNQTSAVSGRLSAKHPNFQALPKQPLQISKKQYVHGKEAELVTVHPRTMFIPRQGWTFLSADFCQVELRLLAHLSSDPELLGIFRNPDADVFTMLASQWKGIKEDLVSSEDREHAKRIVYSVVYGAGRERLSGILGVSADQASRFQDSFLQTYREVQTFIQRTIQQCQTQGYVVSIMGRRRSLPHIHSADWGTRNQAERQAVNFVVQGSAADLCKMAMIRIFSQVTSSVSLSARLVAQIHDELLFEVEEHQLQDFALLVKNTMESLQHLDSLGVHLSVPLNVALSSGSSWGSMSELSLPHTPPSM